MVCLKRCSRSNILLKQDAKFDSISAIIQFLEVLEMILKEQNWIKKKKKTATKMIATAQKLKFIEQSFTE